jgi:ribosome-binding protein aMBF1 (putative translation factor)
MNDEIKKEIETINQILLQLQQHFSILVKNLLEQKNITQNDLPENVRDKVTIIDEKDKFVIKPKEFLGKENFAKLSDFVKSKGGSYISDGKNSRFEIRKM